MVAIELYRVMKEVKRLEEQLAKISGSVSSEREEVESRLREARAEEARLKNMLEGAKS